MHVRRYLEITTFTLIVGCGRAHMLDQALSHRASQGASATQQPQEANADESANSAGQAGEQAPAGGDESSIGNKPDISTAPPTGTEAESDPSAEGIPESPVCPVKASTLKPSSYILAQSGTVKEGANSAAVFSVSLDLPAVQTVCVSFKTRDGSATAPQRYQTTAGILVFAPGDLKKTVTVPIVDDDQEESTQTFFLDLSNPVNGTILVATGGTSILDNDYPGPSTLTLSDASAMRGTTGTRKLSFMLTLDKPVGHDVSIQYMTQDLTAKAGVDYDATSGTVVFNAHELAKQVDVTIYGTEKASPDLVFLLNLVPNAEVSMLRVVGAGILRFGN